MNKTVIVLICSTLIVALGTSAWIMCYGFIPSEPVANAYGINSSEWWRKSPTRLKIWNDQELASEAIPYLSSLSNVEIIEISNTDLTNEHLSIIGSNSDTKILKLEYCHIDDNDLSFLKSLSSLIRLDLTGNQIRGPGLSHLSSMKVLWSLNLSKTEIEGKGLEVVKDLPNLEEIHLIKTKLTDEGIEYLCQKRDRVLSVNTRGTLVTDVGYLRQASVITIATSSFPDNVNLIENKDEQIARRKNLHNKYINIRLKAIKKAFTKAKDLPSEVYIPGRGIIPSSKYVQLSAAAEVETPI